MQPLQLIPKETDEAWRQRVDAALRKLGMEHGLDGVLCWHQGDSPLPNTQVLTVIMWPPK